MRGPRRRKNFLNKSPDPNDPKQLRLFYTANQLKDYLNDSPDLRVDESMDDLWKRKLESSKQIDEYDEGDIHGANVYHLMDLLGYMGSDRIPIGHSIDNQGNHYRSAANGHHRIAAAAAVEKEQNKNFFIPVIHFDQTSPKQYMGFSGDEVEEAEIKRTAREQGKPKS